MRKTHTEKKKKKIEAFHSWMLPKEMLWLIRADLITVHYKEHISSSLGNVAQCG